MADLSARPDVPASHPIREPLYGAAAIAVRDQLREPADLTVAIRVAQRMLAAYSDTSSFGEFGYAQAHGALSESLRILLRALDAEPEKASLPGKTSFAASDEQERVRRSVDAQFPAVAAFLAPERGEGQ